MHEIKTIEVNGVTLAYREYGTGDKYLLSTQNFFFKNSLDLNYKLYYNLSIIKQCYNSCAYCDELGSELETKCLNCSEGYIFAPNSTSHCITPGNSNEYLKQRRCFPHVLLNL